MILAGYFASILIGISLGLIGGGGSILTVPVLVYLFGIDAVLATGYSLFIVGATAAVGGVKAALNKLVDFKTAVVFAIPSFIAVFLTRLYLVPALPDLLFSIGDFKVTKALGIMVFFAFIMIAAAISMMRKRKVGTENEEPQELKFNYLAIIIEGGIVGVITGMVGAGGGFLIIPALVLFAKLPMKKAVGTSLIIIAAKSLIGFLGDIEAAETIDWTMLLTITIIAIVGIFIGSWMAKFIDGKKLKTGFGWFVLAMAAYIILKEIVFK